MAEDITKPEHDSLPPATPNAQVPPVETPASEKVEKVKALGFENVDSDDDAFERLVEAYATQQKQYESLYSQMQESINELRQQPVQAPVSQPQDDGSWWNPPDVDLTLVQNYRNPDGSWKPDAPADVRQAADAAQRYYDKWANDLVRRPNEVLPKIIRREAEKIVQDILGRTTAEQREAQARQQVFDQNPWLFEKNPVTGKPDTSRLSQEGQLLDQHFRQAEAKGYSFSDCWDYAYTKHQLAKLQAKPPVPEVTPEDVNDKKKKDLLARANGGSPPRTGSLPTSTAPNKTQNKSLSFGERFRRQAQTDGVTLS